jgi:hypothetical protein
LNQILRRQTPRSHYGSKVPAVTVTVFKYRNKIGKIVVKAVPYLLFRNLREVKLVLVMVILFTNLREVKLYKDKEVQNVKNFFVNV